MSTFFGVYQRNTAPSGCPPSYEITVSLKEHSRHESYILIGAPCATAKEVDYWINALIRDLEAVRQLAKQKLQ